METQSTEWKDQQQMTIAEQWLVTSRRIGISVIRALFDRLSGMYTARWNKGFENSGDIEAWCNVWVLGLEQQGVTPAMAQHGLANCIVMFD